MSISGPRRTKSASGTARGLAALEAVLLFFICAAVLAVLAGQTEAMRTRMRQDMADRQLALLREALVVYFLDQGAFPPGQGDLSAGDAWNAIRLVPSAGRTVSGWPAPVGGPPRSVPLDPWRHAYRYMCLSNDRSGQVIDNGHWPVLVSAGPDGRFGGITDPAAEVDNRRTDELLPSLP